MQKIFHPYLLLNFYLYIKNSYYYVYFFIYNNFRVFKYYLTIFICIIIDVIFNFLFFKLYKIIFIKITQIIKYLVKNNIIKYKNSN